MTIDGLVYLLNSSGVALSQANQRITQLSEENDRLRAELAAKAEQEAESE